MSVSPQPSPENPLRFFRRPGLPLYYQLAELMRGRIESGETVPGARLPNLHEMAKQYDVARVTVRQAVQLLVAEGFLESRQGRGTRVCLNLPGKTYENMRTSWSAMVKRIKGATVELLAAEDTASCPLLRPDERRPAPVYHYMRRVHLKNGVRFAFIDLYLDKRIFDLSPKRFNETTVIPVMDELGIKVARACQELTIDTAGSEIARHLRLPIGSPVVLLRRIAHDDAGCIIYAAKVVHPGSRVRFNIDLVNS